MKGKGLREAEQSLAQLAGLEVAAGGDKVSSVLQENEGFLWPVLDAPRDPSNCDPSPYSISCQLHGLRQVLSFSKL